MADLLDLGRRGQAEALAQALQAARNQGRVQAATALEAACAWLLAGDPRQADLAYLEADQLEPALALVPDPWGLWPAAELPPPTEELLAAVQPWLERYRRWRHPDPQALWQVLLPQLQADWRMALQPEGSDALLILGRATAAAAPEEPAVFLLDPPLEPELVRLVADAEIAAEPAASNRFWQLVATIRPHWDLARIRAADLALARGELELSGRWLTDPPAAALANPWFHDVAARHAVASGAVDQALSAWAEASRLAQADAANAVLAEIFEQRRREARRGPGVLQVRSLANRGEGAAAQQLLDRLLEEDPQWQPLRSLREQLQASAAPPPAQPAAAVAAEASAFGALLDRAAARLQALGVAVPAVASTPLPEDAAAAAAELTALSRRFSDYEARFALA
ncbi:MAG: hypothetical protein ACKO5F_12600 [Synechococcus sp.]